MKKQQFIAGIYNYCDRWCERCASTDRCRLYYDLAKADRRIKRRGEDPRDIRVAFQELGRSFRRTKRLIALSAKKFGLDLDEIARQAAQLPKFDRSKIDKHPLAREAMRFFKITRKLVGDINAELVPAAEDANRRAEFMDVKAEAGQLTKVRDAMEVLSWDSSFVAVKIKRAISSLCKDGDDDPDDEGFHLEDARSTATLVLNCLQRDKQALLAIYDWSSDHQDVAVELLAKVERMGRALKQLLPK